MPQNEIIKGARLSLFPHVPISISGGHLYDTEGRTGIFSQWSTQEDAASVGILSNVGIGTMAPTSMLDVRGDVNIQGTILSNGVPRVFSRWLQGSAHSIGLLGSNVGLGTLDPLWALDVRGDVNVNGDILSNGIPRIYGCNIAMAASNHAFSLGGVSNMLVGWDPVAQRTQEATLVNLFATTDVSVELGSSRVTSWQAGAPSVATVSAQPAGALRPRFIGDRGLYDGPYVTFPFSPGSSSNSAMVAQPFPTTWLSSGGFSIVVGARIRDWDVASWQTINLLSFFFRLPGSPLADPSIMFQLGVERAFTSTPTGAPLTSMTIINDFLLDSAFEEPVFDAGETDWVALGITVQREEPCIIVSKNGRIVYESSGPVFEHYMDGYADGYVVDGLCINGIAQDVNLDTFVPLEAPEALWLSGPVDLLGLQVFAHPQDSAELSQLLLDFLAPKLNESVSVGKHMQCGGRLHVDGRCMFNGRCTVSNAIVTSSNVILDSGSALGIGTNEPTNALTVLIAKHLPELVAFRTDGDIASLSDSCIGANSLRIDNALSRVKYLNGYTYQRVDLPAGTRRTAGLIAQEVQGVLPEVVSADAAGRLSVAYGNMVALLVEAIKELEQESRALQQRVADLESRAS
jgi:hypothetical protein